MENIIFHNYFGNQYLIKLDEILISKFNIKLFANTRDEFINGSNKKIALFQIENSIASEVRYPNAAKEYVDSIINVVNSCYYAIFVVTELHEHSENIITILDQQLTHNNVLVITSVQYNYYEFQKLKLVFWPFWLDAAKVTIHIKEVNDKLVSLNPFSVKNQLFDILLGSGGDQKPHRNFIFEMINNSTLKDKVIMNYRSRDYKNANNDYFLDEEGIERIPFGNDFNTMDPKFSHSSQLVKIFNRNVAVSNIIPISIYEQTAYSIVAETDWLNHFTLITEKTFKPILAKRLFIVFAGQHHLKNLRALGFKTFDGIIDETYDTIADPYVRWALAFNQLLWLETQPQDEIFERIRLIVEHNYQLATNFDFELSKILDNFQLTDPL